MRQILNLRPGTLELLEEKQRIFQDVSLGQDLPQKTPIGQGIIVRIHKWDFIKLKSFCTAKGTASRVIRQTTELRGGDS